MNFLESKKSEVDWSNDTIQQISDWLKTSAAVISKENATITGWKNIIGNPTHTHVLLVANIERILIFMSTWLKYLFVQILPMCMMLFVWINSLEYKFAISNSWCLAPFSLTRVKFKKWKPETPKIGFPEDYPHGNFALLSLIPLSFHCKSTALIQTVKWWTLVESGISSEVRSIRVNWAFVFKDVLVAFEIDLCLTSSHESSICSIYGFRLF